MGSTERLDDPTDASLFSFQDMFLFLKKLCKSFIVNLVFDKNWLRFQEIGSNVNISVEVVEASNFDPGWAFRISQISFLGFLSAARAGGTFIGWIFNLDFEFLVNCLWGLKQSHPLCSRGSALQSTLPKSTVLLRLPPSQVCDPDKVWKENKRAIARSLTGNPDHLAPLGQNLGKPVH